MNHTHRFPRIVLATDLGHRCDRALERAALLARASGIAPVAATVVEAAQSLSRQVPMHELPDWYDAPSPRVRAERQLYRDLAATGLQWRTHTDEGDAGECLLRVLGQEAGKDAHATAPLVVTGPVREGALGGIAIGSTVDRLLRRPATTLLMVRQRAHRDYRRVLVASDFSAPSRAALLAARALFPQARISLLHGFDIPLFGLLESTRDEALLQARARLRVEAVAFLREAGLDPDQTDVVVEYGDPARLVQQYAETFEPDLVALGSHGHGAVFEMVVGSVAKRIIGACSPDTLVVRA